MRESHTSASVPHLEALELPIVVGTDNAETSRSYDIQRNTQCSRIELLRNIHIHNQPSTAATFLTTIRKFPDSQVSRKSVK